MRAETKTHRKGTAEKTTAPNAQNGVIDSAGGSGGGAHEDIHHGMERSGVEHKLAVAAAILAYEERILHQHNVAPVDFDPCAVAGMGSDSQAAGYPGACGNADLAVPAYFCNDVGGWQTACPVRGVIPRAATRDPRRRVLGKRESRNQQHHDRQAY